MNSIKISVIVPVYNVEKYIKRAIDSLVTQTYKNLEIILVDDGSTDDSGLICDKYAAIDNRIRVIHKKNGGLVSARKAGISIASGEYTVNLDSDDWIELDAYEHIVQIIKEKKPDVIAFGMKKEYEDYIEKQPIQIKQGQYTKKEFWTIFCNLVVESPFFTQPILMSQCDKVVKTKLLRKHELNCREELNKNEDDAVIFPMLLDMSSIYIDTRCWYHYCVRKSSILWKREEDDFRRYQILAFSLIDAYKKYGKNSNCSTEFLLYKLIHHLMLDVPEYFFLNNQCTIYSKNFNNSKVIVYGKGVFANRIINIIEKYQYCHIIDNVDSKDIDRLKEVNEKSYDYIIIAIFNARIVTSALNLLKGLQINPNKILIIEKSNITTKMLPSKVEKAFMKLCEKSES